MDTVQQPEYIYICENSTSHEGGKIQAAARWEPNTPPPHNLVGLKESERGGSEIPGLQPALEIHTWSADTRCTGCWILEKRKSKTCGQVPTTGAPETKEKRVLSARLKETGTP